MLDVILSSGMVYVYAVWVLVLVALCVAFPPRIVHRVIHWVPRRVRLRRGAMPTPLRFRQLR
jgi:hypothetical protein